LHLIRKLVGWMSGWVMILSAGASSAVKTRAALQLENIALRHQIGVLQRSAKKRPQLHTPDRLLWVWLSRVWADWRSALVIVKPETVIAWHRKAFRLFWTWKIRRGKPGRPPVQREVRDLIRRMSRENPGWGAPRLRGELLKLGINVGETSVSKYLVRNRKPPSQTWRTFLENHVKSLVSVDFFTVPTIRFQVLYVFLVMAHERRRIVHFAVTAHPTAEWAAQQLREAFPWDSAPRSPWQRAYVERMIDTIRRECLDHLIVFNEASLCRHLQAFIGHYHRTRTHLALDKDAPDPRSVQPPDAGHRLDARSGRAASKVRTPSGLTRTPRHCGNERIPAARHCAIQQQDAVRFIYRHKRSRVRPSLAIAPGANCSCSLSTRKPACRAAVT
jgi:transposase InsO family protein